MIRCQSNMRAGSSSYDHDHHFLPCDRAGDNKTGLPIGRLLGILPTGKDDPLASLAALVSPCLLRSLLE